jgi:undecaprenyl-diphosphatase
VVAGAYVAVEFGDLFLKQVYRRTRPALWSMTPESFSFPSGHAMSAVAGFGLAAMLVARLYPGTRRVLAVMIPLLAFGIGFSRLALGVHFPTDVMGGWAAGGVIYCAAVIIVDAGDRRVAGADGAL